MMLLLLLLLVAVESRLLRVEANRFGNLSNSLQTLLRLSGPQFCLFCWQSRWMQIKRQVFVIDLKVGVCLARMSNCRSRSLVVEFGLCEVWSGLSSRSRCSSIICGLFDSRLDRD